MPRLELRPLRLSDAPYAILEHAHWVPFSAGLSEKFRPKQSESAPDEKLFMRLRRLWRNQEVWLSHALECVLLGCGPSLLAEVFGGAPASPDRCGLYQADWPGLNRDVGVPDLIVIRDATLYLVEVKSGATASKHRYSRQQHAKYMKFAALAICSNAVAEEHGSPLPISKAEHWLLAPPGGIEHNVNDFPDWRPVVDREGRLTIGSEAARRAIEEDIGRFLRAKAATYELAIERYAGSTQTPTKLVPWSEFAGNLSRVAEKGGRPDLVREAVRLEELSEGKAPVRTTA